MTVVVGYVPDATGLLAVDEAARQAQWRGTDLVILNVLDEAGFTRPTAADEKTLDAVGERLRAQGVDFRVDQVDAPKGHVSDELLRVAQETRADLVVVGLQRRSAVGKALLGSTAQRVLLEAPCPVLAVRAEPQA